MSAARPGSRQSHGIHPFKVGDTAKLHADLDQALFFGANGELVS